MTTRIRLANLLALLRIGRSTSKKLARSLGVCRRTVQRDIQLLRTDGYRIGAVRGPSGGFWLQAQSKPVPTQLTHADLRTLAVRLAVCPIASTLTKKLVDSLPSESAFELQLLLSSIRVEPEAPVGKTPPETYPSEELITELGQALAERRVLSFVQRCPDGSQTYHCVEPIGLVVRGSTWFLSSRDPLNFTLLEVSVTCVRYPKMRTRRFLPNKNRTPRLWGHRLLQGRLDPLIGPTRDRRNLTDRSLLLLLEGA